MADSTDKPAILIVEDQDDLRRMQRLSVQAQGFVADEASNGPDALAYLEKKRPVLVLLDITMPEMSGLEVLKAIRSNPATADLPVILLTALASEKDRALGMDLGATAYVTKPCPLSLLRETLNKVLGKSA